jgi:predicted Zn finger-like uncharacterized protein
MAASFQCPKCAQRYTLKEGMAGKTVKCAKCGEAFHIPPAGASATKAGPPAKGDRPVARRLTAAASGPQPAPVPAAPKVALDELLGGAASEAHGPDAAWQSPVRTPGRAPPPLPAPAGAKKPNAFERGYFNIAVVIIFVGLMTVCFAILGVNMKWLADKTTAMAWAIAGTCIAGVGLPIVLYAVRRNLLVGVPSVLGVVAILAVAWVYQPFTKSDEGPVKRRGVRPPSLDAPAPPSVPKTPPPDPGPAPPTDADNKLEELADEAIARFAELNDLLASARDAASSAAAIAKVPALLRRVEELNNERRILQSQGARLTPQKQQQLDTSTKAMETQQLERMSQQIPQYLELMDELTKEVSPGGPPKKKP